MTVSLSLRPDTLQWVYRQWDILTRTRKSDNVRHTNIRYQKRRQRSRFLTQLKELDILKYVCVFSCTWDSEMDINQLFYVWLVKLYYNTQFTRLPIIVLLGLTDSGTERAILEIRRRQQGNRWLGWQVVYLSSRHALENISGEGVPESPNTTPKKEDMIMILSVDPDKQSQVDDIKCLISALVIPSPKLPVRLS